MTIERISMRNHLSFCVINAKVIKVPAVIYQELIGLEHLQNQANRFYINDIT
ncbi:hypothetical protein NTGM5_70025 [Candidatus Nitrotoga sp. M5]|nr:hypothetical protein NTGM5_70025 [Candidatus Nitrotoga sp. M5]